MNDVVDLTDDVVCDASATPDDLQAQLDAIEDELQQVEHKIARLHARQQSLIARREQLQQRAHLEARAPKADWMGSFDWDARALALLHTTFQLPSYRPLQRQVINATMQGRDVLCLMPSGGGKVGALRALGVRVEALTGVADKDEANRVLRALDNVDNPINLLYATPEKLVNARRLMAKLEKLYKAGRLARVAVDEAHCCSQWGNDFRPDYKKLGALRVSFPDTPILALTATATSEVCDDLKSILRMPHAEVFKASINRPNLLYEVRAKPSDVGEHLDQMAGWVTRNFPGGESGIVYCLTRKDCETVAQDLRQRGIPCCHYHADMDASERLKVHDRWAVGDVQVIVATIAFGMGINKASVRFVIHHTMSKSFANYYQESGRAGRDGAPAHCLLYFRVADVLRQAAITCMEPAWETNLVRRPSNIGVPAQHVLHAQSSMLRYASAVGVCRRQLLSSHFDEAPPPCDPPMCDACRRAAAGVLSEERDVTDAACHALRVLRDWAGADKRATLLQLLDKWKPEKKADASLTRDEAEHVVGRLLQFGCLSLSFGFTAYSTTVYFVLGAKAQGVLSGGVRIMVAFPSRDVQCLEPAAGSSTGV